jgi:hypothetical protein
MKTPAIIFKIYQAEDNTLTMLIDCEERILQKPAIGYLNYLKDCLEKMYHIVDKEADGQLLYSFENMSGLQMLNDDNWNRKVGIIPLDRLLDRVDQMSKGGER